MSLDDPERIDCGCLSYEDSSGEVVLVPDAGCELHWHQVIDADLPPAQMFP